MGVFKTSAPIPPGPKSKFNAGREAETVKALAETQTLFERLITMLAPFRPKQITDAAGQRVMVLAQDLGQGPVIPAEPRPFQLTDARDEDGLKVRIHASTLGGELPDGFSDGDEPPYIVSVTGNGKIWGGISINDSTGEITGRWLDKGTTVPANTTTEKYVLIGSWWSTGDTLLLSNSRYGPIDVDICRNWFAAASPFYGVSFN